LLIVNVEEKIRGDDMLSLKPRQLNEEGIVEKLKEVYALCDAEDFKTKKFVGLINDYIPYQSGLKIRLEWMGKQGYIEQLEKLKRENNPSMKIEKMALQFAKEYGFVAEDSYKTFAMMARAMSLKTVLPQNATLKIVTSVQGAQGNFSKKHIQTEEASRLNIVQAETRGTAKNSGSGVGAVGGTAKGQASSGTNLPKVKRKFVRNKTSLWLYVFYLLMIPVGYYTLYENYGSVNEVFTLVVDTVKLPIYSDPWFIGIMIATSVATLLPVLGKWTFKGNVVSLYPLLMLLAQVVLVSIEAKFPMFVMGFQLAIGLGMLASFAILAAYAMRLPKGAKEYLAYQSLTPYYLSAIIWFLGQYIVLARVL
jgi:hypothetical protein